MIPSSRKRAKAHTQYFTSLLETEVFKQQFGSPNGQGGYSLSSSDQSLWVSIIQVGEVVGSLAAGPVG